MFSIQLTSSRQAFLFDSSLSDPGREYKDNVTGYVLSFETRISDNHRKYPGICYNTTYEIAYTHRAEESPAALIVQVALTMRRIRHTALQRVTESAVLTTGRTPQHSRFIYTPNAHTHTQGAAY